MPGFLYSTLNEVTLVGQSLCACVCVLGALRLQSFISLSGRIMCLELSVWPVRPERDIFKDQQEISSTGDTWSRSVACLVNSHQPSVSF